MVGRRRRLEPRQVANISATLSAPTANATALALVLVTAILCSHPTAAELRTKYFFVESPKATSETTYEFEDEARTNPNLDLVERTNTIAEELDIWTRGWAYHPALAIFSLNLRPRFELENSETTGGFKRRDRNVFFGYTLDSTFLQFKPYTFKIFSSRDRNDFNSTLSADNVTKTAIDRGTLFLKYDPLPTTMTVERTATNFQGFNDFRDTTLLGRVETTHITDQSNTFVRGEYARQTREIESFFTGSTTTFNVDRGLFSASNRYQFSDDVRLSSAVLFNLVSSDDFTTKNVTASEALFLQHADNLSSDYLIQYDGRHEDDFFSRMIRGLGRVQHQLYENLTTNFRVEAENEDFTGGNIRNYEGDLDFDYRRRIPWGSVGASLGGGIRLTDNNNEAVFRQVRDEALVLTGTALVFLAEDNVDITTIVVTDPAQNPFIENTDYVVTVVGNSVAITRIILGAINDGDTVLVDYSFTPQAPFQLYNATLRGGTKLDLWRMLSLTYDYSRSQDHLVSGIPPTTLTDDTVHTATAQFRWRWTNTRFEYEIRQTTRTPLEQWSVDEVLTFRPLPRLSFGLSGSYAETTLTDTNEFSRAQGAGVTARYQPFRWGHFAVEGRTRRIRGDVQRTNDDRLVARFRWQFGLWSGEARYDFVKQRDFGNNQRLRRQIVLLRLTREFR